MTAVTCPGCGSTRTVETETTGRFSLPPTPWCDDCVTRQETEAANREQRNLFMNRANHSGLPEALHRKNISVDTELGQTIRAWAAGDVPVLVLTGPAGVGKTFAAAAACWHAFNHRPVRWIEVALRMAQLTGSFTNNTRHEALTAFTGTGAAVFDDLDKVAETRYGLPALFAAIDTRVARRAPILATLNSGLTKLARTLDEKSDLGQSIASRLASGTIMNLTGPDRRIGGTQ